MKKLRAFFCAVVILGLLQALLVPKYTGNVREGNLIREYYDNAGGNDVIFIGDCEVYENFSPITLWQEYGIPSYIRGSPQQTVWQSYYLLEETLRYETPKVVVFNVFALKYDTVESTGDQSRREAYNRITLEGMRWSGSKWGAIQASLTQEERQWGGALTYVFPILRYHDRWSELTWKDVRYLFKRETVSDCGYLMQTGVEPMTDPFPSPPLTKRTLGDNSWRYLDKMVQLCRDKGVQLVLVKSPGLYPAWWPEWDQQVADYARERELLYINMIPAQEEIGIDWSTDTYDAGLHLNVSGAEKAASWFGRILREQCGLPDRRSDPQVCARWEEKTARYEARKGLLLEQGDS